MGGEEVLVRESWSIAGRQVRQIREGLKVALRKV